MGFMYTKGCRLCLFHFNSGLYHLSGSLYLVEFHPVFSLKISLKNFYWQFPRQVKKKHTHFGTSVVCIYKFLIHVFYLIHCSVFLESYIVKLNVLNNTLVCGR